MTRHDRNKLLFTFSLVPSLLVLLLLFVRCYFSLALLFSFSAVSYVLCVNLNQKGSHCTLDCWSRGREIGPAPGAWCITKFISLVQVVPGPVKPYCVESWPKKTIIHFFFWYFSLLCNVCKSLFFILLLFFLFHIPVLLLLLCFSPIILSFSLTKFIPVAQVVSGPA